MAADKVLTVVSRAKPQDWVEIIQLDTELQPLGYLVWAAAGREPGLNPPFILQWAARARYVEVELDEVEFEGERPTAASLSLQWKAILSEARDVVAFLPWQEVGKCVLDRDFNLLRLGSEELAAALHSGEVHFHEGSLRGAFPKIVQSD